MIRVSKNAASILALATLAVGVLVGALAFGGSGTPDSGVAENPRSGPSDSSVDADWVRGLAAEKTSLLGSSLVKDIYLGLSCPTPNSFECDEVTIAVQLEGRAREMRVWVAGRPVEMDPPGKGGPSYWQGSLQPAGLLDGPLRHQAEEGDLRWLGDPAVASEVTVEIETSDRNSTADATDPKLSATYRNVALHAGYG